MSRPKLRVLSLFAGVGGFDLGLERTGGFETIAYSEIEPACTAQLARHFPNARSLGDIEAIKEFPNADVVCAGFPCQDISFAGRGAGLAGSRSGLWREVVRAVRMVRPRFVLLENVGAIRQRGMGAVLGDLAALGYDSEWNCLPGGALGSPDRRDRWWCLAYPPSYAAPLLGLTEFRDEQDRALSGHWRKGWQEVAEELRGVDDGVSARMDGLAALSNAVKPQFPEMLGRAILSALSTADRLAA